LIVFDYYLAIIIQQPAIWFSRTFPAS
jgi:hypothetical protein